MKTKIFGLITMMLVAILAVGVVAAVPLNIDEVKVDGTVVEITDVNRLDIERGEEIEVKVKISSTVDIDDVEVEAFISGYEYNDKERMSDSTHIFDVEADVTYTKTLTLKIPDKVEEDNYKLRILVSDRYGDTFVEDYKLKIDVPRHSLAIKDVILSPEGSVKAGSALLATVRVKNMGETNEDGIKIKVSVPALGISASDYIDELEDDESTTSEELYLRIPKCADAGVYNLKATVEYDEGYEVITEEVAVKVLESDACEVTGAAADKPAKVTPQTIISVGSQSQDVTIGEGGVIYPLTITNAGGESRTYTVDVEGVDDFGSVKITPSSTVVIGAGEPKAVYVYVSADADATAGEKLFAVSISSNGKVLEQVTMTANLVASEAPTSGWAKLKTALTYGLVILVVLLVLLGLIIGFNKLKGDEEDVDESTGQTYY